jgi:RHS repeat-associated protein
MLLSVNYYDEEGRLAKVYKQHYQSGGINSGNYDEISNSYNFEGALTASNWIHHNASTGGSATIANRYDYDHVGRKLRTFEQIDGGTEVLLAEQRYNEIGQLKEKGLGGGLQNIAYSYNERGWLKSSNSNEFSLQLKYQDGDLPQFNGNISGQLWGNSANTDKNFSYSYDKINRLLNGSGTGMSEAISYDVMGNITSLNRDGQNRDYVYNSNQLLRTTGVATLADYQYDPNGNATMDGRTGKALTYNIMNLPETIFGGLSYVYDASGRKIKKKSSGSTTDYIDGIQYTNGAIELIQTEVGIARRNGAAYSYEYNLSNHLGNNWVTFYKNPNGGLKVLQRDDYYAFGLRKSVTGSSTENKYLYNGKELQNELGQYDYGARLYDPVIRRFNNIDALSEISRKNSPYSYALNNPICFIDVDGMYAGDPPGWLKSALDFFGIGTSQPKSNEEVIQKAEVQERFSRVAANNKQVEKNLENLDYIPGVGAAMKMSKGISAKDNTAIAAGAGAALMDVFGGKTASKVTEKVLGPALRKLVGEGLEAAGKEGAGALEGAVSSNFNRFVKKIPANSKSSAAFEVLEDGN